MTKLIWGKGGERLYEAGVFRGAFYPALGPGIVWNGLISVAESTENSETMIVYIDGERQTTEISLGTFAAEISAFTYPPEFEAHDGISKWELTAQPRLPFNFTYQTLIGSGKVGLSLGYKIHLVYNAVVSPVQRTNTSLNQNVSVEPFTWALSTTPVIIPEMRPSSHLVIDSRSIRPETLELIEDMLYGTDETDSHFPTIEEVLEIFESTAIFIVTHHGDGTATISGPDDWVFQDDVDPTLWHLHSPSIYPLNDFTVYATSY